jgi:hypothetical protein
MQRIIHWFTLQYRYIGQFVDEINLEINLIFFNSVQEMADNYLLTGTSRYIPVDAALSYAQFAGDWLTCKHVYLVIIFTRGAY